MNRKKLLSALLLATLFATTNFMHASSDAYEALKEAATSEEADFQEALEAAREAGLSEAEIVELSTLNHLRDGNLEGLFEMLPGLEEFKKDIPLSMENVFQTEFDLDGFIASLKSIDAYQTSDFTTFETEAKRAFWLAPQFAQMFQIGQLIQQYRQEAANELAMQQLTIPMDMEINDVDGGTVTLGSLMEGKKALLIDFWASWCGPCMAAMPSLQEKHDTLSTKDVYVMGLNTDEKDQKQQTLKVKQEKQMDMPWFMEPEARPLSRLLNVNSIPRMVLITPDGKVHYNGHPMDPSLHTALHELGIDS